MEVFETTSPRASANISYIVASRSYLTDRVKDTVSQLLHCCVLLMCCDHNLATAVVYRAII
jgi:glutaminase